MVINGPRFSTKAESGWYVSGGADIISMAQYPETVLAAELNMGFANLALSPIPTPDTTVPIR